MKKISIVILLLAFSLSLYAQVNDKKETEIFLLQIISSWNLGVAINDSNVIYIEDKPDFSNIENSLFKTSFDASKGWHNINQIVEDTVLEKVLSFDKYDSIAICKQIKKHTQFVSILKSQPNVQIISSKKIKKTFKHDAYKGWAYIHKYTKYKDGFNSISLPLFYRNYTRAIFYEANHCGPLCGNGAVSVYYKINNVWIKKGALTAWIS